MNTPICDFVNEYAKKRSIRFHMPGHKGENLLFAEKYDITEIDGADELYNPRGIIKQSEENVAKLFGAGKTLYSTEGSSLSIRAMLYLVTLYANQDRKKPLILAARNVHSSFVFAAAILDFDIEWMHSDNQNSILSCEISSEWLQKRLTDIGEKPAAVYITSPDYLGNIADIKALADVCHKYNTLLLVDNAHGAYLNFLPQSLHPVSLGADICCDSAHKTLPVLTGGGYLHISKNAPQFFFENTKRAMSLFASTSPSYLILQSLDFANKYLYDSFKNELSEFLPKTNDLKEILTNAGYNLIGNEPLKVSILTKKYGYLGKDFADILMNKNIVCEFADHDCLVLMLSTQNTDSDLENVKKALLGIPKKPEIKDAAPSLPRTKMICSLRQAVMSAGREIDVDFSLGKTFVLCNIGCPPAVPILMPGEEIDENAIKLFKYYGIYKCRVLDPS